VRAFLDSSALAKLYLQEPGRARVEAQLAETDVLILSMLALPEVISALSRLRRAGGISNKQYLAKKQRVVADIGDAAVVRLTDSVVKRAVECLEHAPLRASDAIQVASAIEAGVDRFVSADRRQCKAARAMGLRVEEVASHR